MVMTKPGVRSHMMYNHYKLFSIAPYVAWTVALAVYFTASHTTTIPYIGFKWVIGSLILLWEATEIGYAYALDGKLITDHEHINPIDGISLMLNDTYYIWFAHSMRVISGIMLLIYGTV
jgi:hypothetical protein